MGESVSAQKFNKIVALFNGKDDIAIKGRINTFLDEFKGIKAVIDDKKINGEAPLVTKFKKIEDIPYQLIGELAQKITVDSWIKCYETAFKK